ncbi:MAG: type 4a pilus biogenesis protein PilO [Elusimicrobiota bacterium]
MAIKLTKQQQQYLAVGAVVLIAGAVLYFKFFWLPYAKKISETKAKIEDLTAKIDRATKQAARLPRVEAELVSLNEQAIEAEKRLPKTKSVPDILVTINALAAKNHVVVLSFGAPPVQKSQTYFTELSFPVTARGSFHNVGKFLAALALEERIFNVLNVTYPEPVVPLEEMSIGFTLVSYQYKG